MRKVIFITGHEFGFSALKGLLESKHYNNFFYINLLITLEDKCKENISGYKSFNEIANKYNIPHVTQNINEKDVLYDIIYAVKPDYIFCIGWSRLLSNKILDIPKYVNNGVKRHSNNYGCIGMHPTLLPEGRGRAPLPWTILNGLEFSGLSTFFLEEVPDSGRIIIQDKIPLSKKETSYSLFQKMKELHYIHGNSLSDLIAKNKVHKVSRVQDESKATYWHKRDPKDSEIDFRKSGDEIERLCRAMVAPYPSAFIKLSNKVYQVEYIEHKKTENILEVGKVINQTNDYIEINIKDGIIKLRIL